MTAYVLLEDGTRFDGEACAAPGPAVGEVVFTTGMSGYQECVTDPSFHAQLLTFTAPMVGNYGASAAAMESPVAHARGAIMREAVNATDAPAAEAGWLDWLRDQGVPGITDVDTRALVRHIRDAGAMLGGIFPGSTSEAEARALIAAEPSMIGRDLAREITPAAPVVHAGDGSGPRIVALDTGIKTSIIRNFTERGATLELLPCTTPADAVLARGADGIFLVPGPGDPAAMGPLVQTVRDLIGRTPVFGICLGHQLLSQAVGLETFKLPFGHRGGNHPVKDLRTGRVAITAQNHGFALEGEAGERFDTPFGAAEVSHTCANDGVVEGIKLVDGRAFSVQYHPEAAAGPHDANYLFDQFVDLMAGEHK